MGLQIVLDSRITPSDTHDAKVLGPMLETINEQGLDMGTSAHSCDTAYDSEENFALLFDYGLTPNIRQRSPGKNPKKSKEEMPNRAKGAELFDPVEYTKRDMIEGIFGAEEAKNHQLHCRFIKEGNMRRFGKIRGIGWSIKCSTAFAVPKNPAYPSIPEQVDNRSIPARPSLHTGLITRRYAAKAGRSFKNKITT